MTNVIALSARAESALDLFVGLAAAIALVLIWIHVTRPHLLKRVAFAIAATMFALAVGLTTYLWYAANYMMDWDIT